MSLGVDGENKTPAQAFARKMLPRGEIVGPDVLITDGLAGFKTGY